MSLSRRDHLNWCKERALTYLANGDQTNAVLSFLSDMSKHEETTLANPTGAILAQLGTFALMSGNDLEIRRWIEGFN